MICAFKNRAGLSRAFSLLTSISTSYHFLRKMALENEKVVFSHDSGEENKDFLKEFQMQRLGGVEIANISDWRKIQDELRLKVVAVDTEEWQHDFSKLKFIAGLDISTPKESHSQMECVAVTAMAILAYPFLKIVHQEVMQTKLDQPYVPGFLAFRELPAVKELVEKVLAEKPHFKPDVLIIDGNGILHPQRCGLACHIGLALGIATVGVAKNLHHVPGLINTSKVELQSLPKRGDFIHLKSESDEILGMALKTSDDSKNPVYVSVGHLIGLETARKVVLAVSKGNRISEPIRVADHISRELIRKMGKDTELYKS